MGLEYKGRGRLADPSGCIAVDFRKVPMEIAMVGRAGRTEIKAQEEARSRAGSARQELAEGGVAVPRAQSLEMFPVRSHICGSGGAEARAGWRDWDVGELSWAKAEPVAKSRTLEAPIPAGRAWP